MSKKNNLFLGKAGEFAIISEFLCRGWNVAIPEVDSGDDVFVVRDSDGVFSRVQVKTSNGQLTSSGIKAQFQIPLQQLKLPVSPELEYVFIVRFENKWMPFVLISRKQLSEKMESKLNTDSSKYLNISMRIENQRYFFGQIELTEYINNFERFPLINH